jgi:hypothetical protein
MKHLLIALIIWMLPVVLGTQLIKEYKLRHDFADFMLLLTPFINWIVLIVLIAEALEIYTSEQG